MATHRVSPLVLMGLALAICSHFSDLPLRDEPKVKTKATILIILAELYVMAFAFMDKQTWTFERKRSVILLLLLAHASRFPFKTPSFLMATLCHFCDFVAVTMGVSDGTLWTSANVPDFGLEIALVSF